MSKQPPQGSIRGLKAFLRRLRANAKADPLWNEIMVDDAEVEVVAWALAELESREKRIRGFYQGLRRLPRGKARDER